MRIALILGIFAVACVLPGIASAHVGRTLPVATDFTARIIGAVSGVDAKVADGDQSLWLRAPAASVVFVPGILGEPLLRFDDRGVWLNLRSPTAQSDRIDPTELRPSANGEPPLWHRVTRGHAYLWHEHRLHALEPVARLTGSAGPWSIPLVVDGRRTSLRLMLTYSAPGATWAWLAVPVVLALVAGLGTTRSAPALVVLAVAAAAAVWAIRVGRELYGRPGVPVIGWIEIGITSVIATLCLVGLTRRDPGMRVSTAFFVGVGALYEGLTMLPVLTHAIALNALPSLLARILEAIVIAAGVGVLGGSVFGPLRAEETT